VFWRTVNFGRPDGRTRDMAGIPGRVVPLPRPFNADEGPRGIGDVHRWVGVEAAVDGVCFGRRCNDQNGQL